MAIRYPSTGSIIYTTINADTRPILLDAIKTQLVNAGWTSTSVAGYVVLTLTGLPINNETVTFDGVTYTWKTTINNSNPREVLIGASATACASNLVAAITGGAGSGTTYSSATTAHATCTASSNAGVVTVTYSTTGTASIGKTASEGMSNATLDSTSFRFGGYKLDTAVTPHGLQGRLYIYDNATSTQIALLPSSCDETAVQVANVPILLVSVGRTFRFHATAYSTFIWTASDATNTDGTHYYFIVPYIRGPQRGTAVTGAVDNGSGLVRLTATAHGLTTGNSVFVAGVKIAGSLSSAINGTRTVTVIDANTLDLQSTSWPGGTYTSSTGVVGLATKSITRCIISAAASGGSSWRNNTYQATGGGGRNWLCLNETYWDAQGGSISIMGLLVPADNAGNVFQNFGGYSDLVEPRIHFRTSAAATNVIVGDLWAAFITVTSVTMDVTKSGFDSHDWINFTSSYSKGSLWLATN